LQLAFKIIRTNGHDELIAETDNLHVGRAAYDEARRLYPKDLIELRSGARPSRASSGRPGRRQAPCDRRRDQPPNPALRRW
jgi:hypothetical protein